MSAAKSILKKSTVKEIIKEYSNRTAVSDETIKEFRTMCLSLLLGVARIDKKQDDGKKTMKKEDFVEAVHVHDSNNSISDMLSAKNSENGRDERKDTAMSEILMPEPQNGDQDIDLDVTIDLTDDVKKTLLDVADSLEESQEGK